jgi:hypothetical protein
MYYLSFDIANKSLATSFIYYNNLGLTQNYDNIKHIKNNTQQGENAITLLEKLNKINNCINDHFKYIYSSVKDLIPNKKVKDSTIIERSNGLKQYMNELKYIIDSAIIKNNIHKIYVLVEYQLSSNYNANAIYNQIIYEFSNPNKLDNSNYIYEIVVMNPSYKNKIYFHKELKHSSFIQKYTNNYVANKNHCKSNFLYFLKSFNLLHIIDNIKAKNIDDIADSFMQIFAFIKFIK